MFRASTVLAAAAAAAAAALAVSAAPASADSTKPLPSSPQSHTATHLPNVNHVEGIDFAVKDGTSNTTVFAERGASFTIDIGTSEAARNGNVKPPTPTPNLAHVKSGSKGIIAVLIGL